MNNPVVKIPKKVIVKANSEFHWYRFVQFKGLELSEYRALKDGQEIEITKAAYEFNKQLLKEVK